MAVRRVPPVDHQRYPRLLWGWIKTSMELNLPFRALDYVAFLTLVFPKAQLCVGCLWSPSTPSFGASFQDCLPGMDDPECFRCPFGPGIALCINFAYRAVEKLNMLYLY